ncbi:uncharacterized protein LOC109848370 isoform X1 [Asparagus officinalis]|uniref:uncharacterized protein LOC109848370 isoform X1 n=1 Tax=Asparagus officinalis TaxID=4686 RepID=UPI00098DFDB3|nr:uncharacterized protein LOC109848370 isoform X1 [Asparagus officinalis]
MVRMVVFSFFALFLTYLFVNSYKFIALHDLSCYSFLDGHYHNYREIASMEIHVNIFIQCKQLLTRLQLCQGLVVLEQIRSLVLALYQEIKLEFRGETYLHLYDLLQRVVIHPSPFWTGVKFLSIIDLCKYVLRVVILLQNYSANVMFYSEKRMVSVRNLKDGSWLFCDA